MPNFLFSLISIKELRYPRGWEIIGERNGAGTGASVECEVLAYLNEVVPQSKVEQFANQLARELAGQPVADWV